MLILCTASSIGGTERSALEHAKALSSAGCQVFTRMAVSERSEGTIKWFADNGVEAIADPRLLDVHVSRSISNILPLTNLVQEIRPQVVVIHYGVNHISFKDIVAIRLARPKRVFAILHHPTPLEEMPLRTHKMTRYASKICDGIVCPTNVIRQQMLSIGISDEKLFFVPYAIPTPATFPTQGVSRALWGIKPDDFVVSCLSRIEAEKGIGELIDACAMALKEIPNLKLLIGGTGSDLELFQKVAESKLGDRAILPGRIGDPSDLFAATDIFCLPSYLEGFGLVYLEAAHFGLTCIGTNIGGIPEAIIDSKTGLLVPVKDIVALSRAIIEMYRNPLLSKTYGRAAKERVLSNFSVPHARDLLLKVLFK